MSIFRVHLSSETYWWNASKTPLKRLRLLSTKEVIIIDLRLFLNASFCSMMWYTMMITFMKASLLCNCLLVFFFFVLFWRNMEVFVSKKSLITWYGTLLNKKRKCTKMTQINCVITRMTHIIKKLSEYFSGRNYPYRQL